MHAPCHRIQVEYRCCVVDVMRATSRYLFFPWTFCDTSLLRSRCASRFGLDMFWYILCSDSLRVEMLNSHVRVNKGIASSVSSHDAISIRVEAKALAHL